MAETNNTIWYGYKQKSGGAYDSDNLFGVKGFSHIVNTDANSNTISLQDFYDNYTDFIEDGNFIVINSNVPTTTVLPKIFLQKIELTDSDS